MAVLSMHHVSMIVADTAKALTFYRDILELPVSEARPELGFPGAWLQLGAQQIHLLEVPNPDPVGERPQHGGRDRHLALAVDALAPFEQRLQAAGLTFTRSKSGRQALFCRDYDGNTLELIEVAAADQ